MAVRKPSNIYVKLDCNHPFQPWKSRSQNRGRLQDKRREREVHLQKVREDLSNADEKTKEKRTRIGALTFFQLRGKNRFFWGVNFTAAD